MDIQKEREAFECEFKQTDYYIAHGDLSTLMLCDDQYALNDVQVSFEMWQSAKAQAVPEGYVLMPIKPTETMVMAVVKEHEGDAFLPYSLYDAYVKQAMIEAQEPAND